MLVVEADHLSLYLMVDQVELELQLAVQEDQEMIVMEHLVELV